MKPAPIQIFRPKVSKLDNDRPFCTEIFSLSMSGIRASVAIAEKYQQIGPIGRKPDRHRIRFFEKSGEV